MPIILPNDRKSWKTRLVIACIYMLLIIGGATMVYPFLITLTSSFSGRFDYHRFAPFPQALVSREDRFVRNLEGYFDDQIPDDVFRNRPAAWGTWLAAGEDRNGIPSFAQAWLAVEQKPETLARWRVMSADYAAFLLDYDIHNTICRYDSRDLAGFLREKYSGVWRAQHATADHTATRQEALDTLRAKWGIPYENFYDITLDEERRYPMHHSSWDYPDTAKAQAFIAFKDAYRKLAFRPGAHDDWRAFLKKRNQNPDTSWPMTSDDPRWPLFREFAGISSPASQTRPFLLQPEWVRYFNRTEVKERYGIAPNAAFTVANYNRLFNADYRDLRDIPFPVPPDAPVALQQAWTTFVVQYYPRRLITLHVTPELQRQYQNYIHTACRTIAAYNKLAGTKFKDFSEVSLPAHDTTEMWRAFVATVPFKDMELHSAETDYQKFLLKKYGSLAAVNRTYGWNLARVEEARVPVAEALTVTFIEHEWRYYFHDLTSNYRMVMEYLFVRGQAFRNTGILVLLMIIATLTVNPLAAYALSRFRLRRTEQILLFLLATMAFPGAVVAIPGFLLVRDLHLLNTFAALVLPILANGMSIFILKSFFDGLPRELFEAAMIDGAQEWRIFVHVALPMTMPILALNTLNAFLLAYNSWEWALLVCQDKDRWTLAVWLYQLSATMHSQPWLIMAGFVVASIPTAIVFITCQKIILRGIVVPCMK
jgi:ABC-type glycerol-3-phosphate transport system permease component